MCRANISICVGAPKRASYIYASCSPAPLTFPKHQHFFAHVNLKLHTLLHFMICHSKKCHRPRTSSCHKGTACLYPTIVPPEALTPYPAGMSCWGPHSPAPVSMPGYALWPHPAEQGSCPLLGEQQQCKLRTACSRDDLRCGSLQRPGVG